MLATRAPSFPLTSSPVHSQLGFVCLGSCGLDVAVNSAIIFIITRGDRDGGETSDITSAARDTKRRGSAYPPNGVSSMPAGTFIAGQNSAIGINPFTPGAPFVPSGLAGVSVSSEVVETEERSQHDDSYVPLRQGWRGSGSGRGSQSGNLLGLPGPTPCNLIDETPVHCLAFDAGDVSADDEEKKSAEERV